MMFVTVTTAEGGGGGVVVVQLRFVDPLKSSPESSKLRLAE